MFVFFKIRICAVAMLTRTYNSAVCQFHCYRRYSSLIIEEMLIYLHKEKQCLQCLCHQIIQRRWYYCLSSTTRAFPKSIKFILGKGTKVSDVLTSTHYWRLPLVKGGMGIPCNVTIKMSQTLKNTQLLDHLMELVETVYSEPVSLIILRSFLADESEVEYLSN